MSRTIKKGAVDQSVYFEVLDSTSTTGARKTGIAFDTSGLTAYYARNQGSATAITLATLAAANSAHSDGGFKEVDSANMPGVYRLDLPDAAVATGAESVAVTIKGVTGMAQVSSEIQLVDNVEADTFARLGAPAGASVSADIAAVKVDTAAIKAKTDNLPADPADASDIAASFSTVNTKLDAIDDFVDTEVAAIKAKTDNLPTDPADASDIAARFDTVDASLVTIAAFVDTEVAAIKAKTDQLTFTTASRVDSQVFGMQTDTITAAAIAADAIGSSELAATAVAEIQSGLSTLDVAGVRAAVGLASANLDTQLTAIDDFIDTEVAAIKAKTDNLPADPADAFDIAARFDTVDASLTTIAAFVDTEVAAIKAKTDNLPADPADASDIAASFTTMGLAVAVIQADTDDIQSRLPAALVGGKIDASVGSVSGDATAAANLAKTTRAIGRGTAAAGSSVTSIVTSAFTPAGNVADQFKGRIVTFDADTTTVALRGQSTDITASTNAAAPVLTVTALTTAPASGDTFSVT